MTKVRRQAGLKLWASLVPGPSLDFKSSDFMHMYAVTLLPVKYISPSLVEVLPATAGTSRVTPCPFRSISERGTAEGLSSLPHSPVPLSLAPPVTSCLGLSSLAFSVGSSLYSPFVHSRSRCFLKQEQSLHGICKRQCHLRPCALFPQCRRGPNWLLHCH